MRKAKDVAQEALTRTQQPAEQPSSAEGAALSEQQIARVFVRMQSAYGHLWTSRFGDGRVLEAAKREWALRLGRFDLETIGRALDLCATAYPDRPPTLGQMVGLCRQYPAPYHRPVADLPALPAPPADRTKGRAALADALALVGVRRASHA